MSGIRQALLLTTSERYVGLLLNFVTMAIISRVLTPTEIGISVIGWAILSIPFALRDLGMTDFIIQRKELSAEATRTAASLGLASSILLIALVLGMNPLIVSIYGDARIGQFLNLIAFAMLSDAISSPILALMRRDLAFRQVVCVNVTMYAVTSGVTIGLALLGASYMSIAWANVVANAAAAALALALRPTLWVFRPTLGRWREVLGFGAYFSSMTVLMRIYEAFPYLALGRFATASTIAHYSRALQVCQLPDKLILSGIISIAFPALAAEAREGRKLKSSYLGAAEYMTVVQWPGLIMLACLAPRVVHIIFGDQWADVVPMVQIMALAWGFGALSPLSYPILYAIGNLRHALAVTLLSLPFSALIMLFVAKFGPLALAASLFITIPLNNFVALQFIRRHLEFGWGDIWKAVRKSVLVTLLSAAGPLGLLMSLGMDFDQPLSVQGLMILLSGGGWLFGLWFTGHPLLSELRHIADRVRARVGAGEAPARGPTPSNKIQAPVNLALATAYRQRNPDSVRQQQAPRGWGGVGRYVSIARMRPKWRFRPNE